MDNQEFNNPPKLLLALIDSFNQPMWIIDKIGNVLMNDKAKEYRKNTPGYSKLSHEKNAEKKSNRRARKLAAGGTFTKKDIDNKMVQQEGKCFYCAKILGLYHVDHFIPLAKGGSNAAENIVIACPSCNLRKGDLMPNVFMKLVK